MPDKLRKYTTYNIDLLIYDILIYSYICWYLRAVSHAAVWFFHEPRAAAEPIRRPRKRSPKMITERSRFEGSKCFALGSNLWTFGGIRGTSDLHWTWAGNLGMCRKNKYALAIWKIPEKRNMFKKKWLISCHEQLICLKPPRERLTVQFCRCDLQISL